MSRSNGINLRCSVVLFRGHSVLLVRRSPNSGGWVLPGGNPRPGESTAACARRETREGTGLAVNPVRVALVLEVAGPHAGERTIDIVFAATESRRDQRPAPVEPDMQPQFVAVDVLHTLDLRPPLAGYLRGMLRQGARHQAAYLPNLWRPPASRDEARPDQGGEAQSVVVRLASPGPAFPDGHPPN